MGWGGLGGKYRKKGTVFSREKELPWFNWTIERRAFCVRVGFSLSLFFFSADRKRKERKHKKDC
jgi:hypothetical protein